MTTIEAPNGSCTTRTVPDPVTTPIPLPRPASSGSWPAQDSARAGRGTTGVVVACLLVTVAAVVATVAIVLQGTPPATATAPTASAPVADPTTVLRRQAATDATAAEATVGSWVPQLSSKRVGTVDAAAVLAEHRQLRATYPQALLVWSGDYTSFRGPDFWVTLLDRPTATAAQVTAWCSSAGLDADHCYAKRLSHSGGPSGNTVDRSAATTPAAEDTTSQDATTAGTVPVVGWSGWAHATTGYGSVRPSELDAGGDGTSVIEDITWQGWGGPTVTGRGTASWVPPTGASADGVPTPAVVVVSDLGACHGHLAYRKVGWYFPGKGETAADAQAGYDHICSAS